MVSYLSWRDAKVVSLASSSSIIFANLTAMGLFSANSIDLSSSRAMISKDVGKSAFFPYTSLYGEFFRIFLGVMRSTHNALLK